MSCVDLQGCEETCTDTHDDGAGVKLGDVVPCAMGELASDNRGYDKGEDEWESVDAGVDSGDAFNGLEPKGKEVDYYHHGAWAYGRKEDAGGDGALGNDSDWDGGIVSGAELDGDEDGDEEEGEDEEEDYSPVGPGVCCSSPL